MTAVAVVGASGFVGSACVESLDSAGFAVHEVSARKITCAVSDPQMLGELARRHPDLPRLTSELRGADVVINAAGIADATSPGWDRLCGANALLPCLLAEAAKQAGAGRFIHLSSAAVQGRRAILDESDALAPFSPYSQSKALAELALPHRPDVVIFRPTSVHGASRPMTTRLMKLARSGWATVAGDGKSPTPQTHVSNVAASVAVCARSDVSPPRVTLQPWEGWTTASFLHMLGGREPHHLPDPAADAALRSARTLGRVLPGTVAGARRLEMLLRGQRQEPGWLDDQLCPRAELMAAWDSLRQVGGEVGA